MCQDPWRFTLYLGGIDAVFLGRRGSKSLSDQSPVLKLLSRVMTRLPLGVRVKPGVIIIESETSSSHLLCTVASADSEAKLM